MHTQPPGRTRELPGVAELTRISALTTETRTQLVAFLRDGLETLGSTEGTDQGDGSEPRHGDLQDELQAQVPASVSAEREQLPGIGASER
jgi:hypothetical protein